MMRLVSIRPWLVVAALAAATLACGRRAAHAPVNDALDAELKRIDASLDRVEERLLASQSSVTLWDELRDRHESASAVTCENLSAHVAAMDRFAANQREKRQGRAKNRLASRVVASGTASR